MKPLAAVLLALLAAGALAWFLLAGEPAAPRAAPPVRPGLANADRTSTTPDIGPPPPPPPPEPPPVPEPPPPAPGEAPAFHPVEAPAPPGASPQHLANAKLEKRIDDLKLEAATLASALEELGRRCDTEIHYESEAVRSYCAGRQVSSHFRQAPARRAIDTLLRLGGPEAVDGRPLALDVSMEGKVTVGLGPAPAPPPATAADVEAAATLLDRLRSERTSVAFEAKPLSSAVREFGLKIRVNIVADPADLPREARISYTASDLPLSDVLDALVAPVPGLRWEATAAGVRLTKK